MKYFNTCAEIDLSAISHNIRELRDITDRKAKFMAVVKADGYGHGSIETALIAIKTGADYLGVARIHEAIVLRQAGIKAPILIFSPSIFDPSDPLLQYDLAQTVVDLESATLLSERAISARKRIKVHLKVDTGMGRIGILPEPLSIPEFRDEALSFVLSVAGLKGIELEGILMHFASSDAFDKSYALFQLDCFLTFLEQVRRNGIEIPIRHAANSGAIIDLPQSHLDMVRAGISLYGLYPSEEVNRTKVRLKPAMTLKTNIIQVKKVPKGFKVSYNSTFETTRPTTIAAVPLGYGDGYDRHLSNKGFMMVRGEKAPIIGRVCMDLTMLDVGHIKGVSIGDAVVAFGKQENAEISADEVASLLGTINYEVVTRLTQRVKRVYIHSE